MIRNFSHSCTTWTTHPQLDGFCCGIEQIERLYREVTDHNLGFHPQTQKLEPPRTA